MASMADSPEGSVLAAIRGYASDVVGCSPDRITTVGQFEDGNRHGVYKVSYLDTSGAATHLVVRVSYGGDPVDCAGAERESQVLKKLGGLAAPLLYDFRRTSPWFDRPAMCMQFVPGQAQELSSATAAELERLGSIVGRLHRQPTEDLEELSADGDMASYAQARMQDVLSRLTWVSDPLPVPVQSGLRDAAESVEGKLKTIREAESFRTREPLVLLHGDIGPGNILWSPDPVLIDWEYSRLGDPADEIAYLFDQNGLSTPLREAFRRGYRETLSDQAVLAHIAHRMDWWEPVILLGSALWWVERWARRTEADAAGETDPAAPKEQAYYFGHVIRRLRRFEELPARD
jgi:aminoglycoside phosphotransferase (APT) family kinase protein